MEIKFTFFIISKSWVCRLKPENSNWRLGPIILLVMGAGAGRETVFLYCLISGLLSSLRFLSPFKGLVFPQLLKNASPLDTQKFETLPCWLSDSFSIHFVICLLGPPDELNSLKNNNKTNKQTNQSSQSLRSCSSYLPGCTQWYISLCQMLAGDIAANAFGQGSSCQEPHSDSDPVD